MNCTLLLTPQDMVFQRDVDDDFEGDRKEEEDEELQHDLLLPAPSSWFESSCSSSNNNKNNNKNETRGSSSPVSILDPHSQQQQQQLLDRELDGETQPHGNGVVSDNRNNSNTKSNTQPCQRKRNDSTSQDPLHTLNLCENPLHFAPHIMVQQKQKQQHHQQKQKQHQNQPEEHTTNEKPEKTSNSSNSISPWKQSSSRPPPNHHQKQTLMRPLPSPSWTELSSQVLPAAARELLSSSLCRIYHTAHVSYAMTTKWQSQYRELGNPTRGYFRTVASRADGDDNDLPPFSSLPWIQRQMVHEWRTYNSVQHHQQQQQQPPSLRGGDQQDPSNTLQDSALSPQSEKKIHDDNTKNMVCAANDEEDEDEFLRARTLVPQTKPRPFWQHAEACFACYKPFGPTRLRHHCRLCGYSFCQGHSSHSHALPHLGYQVPERVCDGCKARLTEHDLAERVAWRLARCRDFVEQEESLCPYFEMGVDTMRDMAIRIADAAITMAKSIPLGAQATVAVETLEVLRRHGLNGIYTILLRQEFLAAADLLRKALGINRTAWPLSVHELSAAIFYALAQHRAYRGLNPELEHEIHGIRHGGVLVGDDNVLLATREEEESTSVAQILSAAAATEAVHLPVQATTAGAGMGNNGQQDRTIPVCDPLPDATLDALIFYAPLALNFIYAEKEVDIQLLAAQQGWRLLYAHLHQHEHSGRVESEVRDLPASAIFVHEKKRIVCLAIRGTSTIHDVVTDIRQLPVPFPEPELKKSSAAEDWTTVSNSRGLAVSGMAGAALNLYREHVDSLLYLAQEGYQIRIVGHSLGGGVASLLGALLRHEFPALGTSSPQSDSSTATTTIIHDDCGNLENVSLRVYAYGTPACIDASLSDMVRPFVVTAVLHDDVVPRLSPSSCRGLLKHLLHIKDTWVKEMLPDDIMAITERAKLVWAPRWREGFTLISTPSSSSIKRYCRKQYCNGKKQLQSMKDKLLKAADEFGTGNNGPIVKSNHVDDETEQCEGKKQEKNPCKMDPDLSSSKEFEEPPKDPPTSGTDSEPHLLVDYIGGVDRQTNGMIIDGDEFFEAGCGSLIEDENEEDQFQDAVDDLVRQQEKEKSYSLLQKNEKSTVADGAVIENSSGSDHEVPEAVVLAETPLPRLYVPGKIAHIYVHRGVYRAVYVPRSFRELRRISMAGNMLSDHKCKAYYEALLEVRTVRRAPEDPPRWTAFDEDDTCSCCASRFTWASTSKSKAQEARDKHNCRSCGTLVCDPCSSNRVPLPSLGLTCTVRVCDRCYNDIDGIGAIQDDEGSIQDEDIPTIGQAKPERRRERRSEVVDELAGRIAAPELF